MTVAQRRDLLGPERAIEWIAVNEHERTTNTGVRVSEIDIVDSKKPHCQNKLDRITGSTEFSR
jgi:hypothetical protein